MVNLDAYPGAPGESGSAANIAKLLGVGAYTIDDSSQGSGLNFGQDVGTETFVKSLIYSVAMGMGTGDGSITSALNNLGTYLQTMPLDSLKLLQPYVPNTTPADFSTIEGAVEKTLAMFQMGSGVLNVDDFNNWVESILSPWAELWKQGKDWWDTVMAQLSSYPPAGSSAATVATWWSTLFVDLGLDNTLSATLGNIISGNYDWAKQAKANWDAFLTALGLGTATSAAGAITTNTSVINQISDIFNGLVVTPINTAVQQIKDWWNNLWQPQTTQVAQNVVNIKNAQSFQISAITSGYRNPSWVCRYPIGDVTYPESQNSGLTVYDSAGSTAPSAGMTGVGSNWPWRAIPAAYVIAQNSSRGGFVTISNTGIFDTVGMVVSWNDVALTANSVFMEVFRENPDLSLTRIYSFDITSSLASGIGYYERTLSPALIGQAGERYLVRLRNISSTGQLGAQGLDLNPSSVKAAWYTSTSGTTNVTSYSTADAATYTAAGTVFAWAVLANKSGTATDQLYSDDFNRSGMGSLWFLQSSTAQYLGPASNQLAYGGTTNGHQEALYVRPTASDRMQVEGTLYNTGFSLVGSAFMGLILNANRDLSQMVMLQVNYGTAKIMSGSAGSLTQRATISSVFNDVAWQFRYDPNTNTYTAYKAGAAVGLSWNDSGNLMGHSALTRYGGARIERASSVNAGSMDNWVLSDWS